MAATQPTQELTRLTLAELQARKQKLKGAIIGLGIVMGVALVVLIYLAMKNGKYGLLSVGLTSFITLMPSVIAMNKINEEIKSRQAG